jgi:hypothetical protein
VSIVELVVVIAFGAFSERLFIRVAFPIADPAFLTPEELHEKIERPTRYEIMFATCS